MNRRIIPAGVVLLLGACAPEPTAPAAIETTSQLASHRSPEIDFCLTLLHNNDGESDLIDAGVGLEDFAGVARFATVVGNLRRDVDGWSHDRWNDEVVSSDAAVLAAETGTTAVPVTGTLHRDHDGRRQLTECASAPRWRRAVVLVSSGDNFLAGPEFNASLTRGKPYYDGLALDLLRYDALAIGNHEFDFGPDVFVDFVQSFPRSRPPFLSANLDFSGEPRLARLDDRDRIARSTIVWRDGHRIGIIGATTPALPFISSPRNVIVGPDVAGAVNRQVHRLRYHGVHIIILISHLQSLAEDLALIPLLDGVDIVVAGGGDELLANTGALLVPGDIVQGPYPTIATDSRGRSVPVVTTAGGYRYVGRLQVGFDRWGRVVYTDPTSGPVRVAGGAQEGAVEPDPEVQALVVDPVAASIAQLGQTVLATTDVELDGRRSRIRTVETNEGNLVSDALLWQAQQLAGTFGVPSPVIALQNGGGIRNDAIIPIGPLSSLTTFSVLPFLNFVSVVADVPREQLKEILENAVSRVEFGDGRFSQVAGLQFVWSATGTPQILDATGAVTTPGTRVRRVTIPGIGDIVTDGAVIPGPGISVATIDFLARGGDQYPFRGLPFATLGVTYQQAFANYLQVGLGGSVTAAAYPAAGQGRIVQLP